MSLGPESTNPQTLSGLRRAVPVPDPEPAALAFPRGDSAEDLVAPVAFEGLVAEAEPLRPPLHGTLALGGSSKMVGFEEARRQPLYWQGYPSLSSREIGRWASAFGLRALHARRVSDPMRVHQATLQLRTDGGDLAMKVYLADDHRQTHLEAIFDLMARCFDAGFPCPRPLLLPTGSYLLRDGTLAIGVYTWLEGENLLHLDANVVVKMTAEQSRAAGALLARWHALGHQLAPMSAVFDPATLSRGLGEQYRAWLARLGSDRARGDPRILHRIETDVKWFELIGPLPKLALQWAHGDATVRNFMFDADQAIALIDFDLAGPAPRLFDLIVLMQAQPEFMKLILEGYQSVSPLSFDERRTLPVLAGGRLLQRFLDRAPTDFAHPGRHEQLRVLYEMYRDVKFRLRELSRSL